MPAPSKDLDRKVLLKIIYGAFTLVLGYMVVNASDKDLSHLAHDTIEFTAKSIFDGKGGLLSLRPTAIPLITIDPYFSCWSFAEKLNEKATQHWTGANHPMNSLIRVDGKTYRFMGTDGYLPIEAGNRSGRYAATDPTVDWMELNYNDSEWELSQGPVGYTGKIGENNKSGNQSRIWYRKIFNVVEPDNLAVQIKVPHEMRGHIYINGHLHNSYSQLRHDEILPIRTEMLLPGKNLIAVYLESRHERQNAVVDLKLLREKAIPKAEQVSVTVTATRSIYEFVCGGVNLRVSFTSPLLLDDLDLLSRPVSYVTYDVVSNDGKKHNVSIYFDVSPLWAVNAPDQVVTWDKMNLNGRPVLKTGTEEQAILKREGDDVRIDWGYLFVMPQSDPYVYTSIGKVEEVHNMFADNGMLPKTNDENKPRPANDSPVALAVSYDLQRVGKTEKSRYIILAYDDMYSIEYFGNKLCAWWKRDGMSSEEMLRRADESYTEVEEKCRRFDMRLFNDVRDVGGEKYAELCVLAYRQAIAAHKLVAGPKGLPLFFSKENYSNGSIATVDITYPSSPLFLAYNPDLLKGMLNPIFDYSESGRWTKPFAAHDVGTYPRANGQKYRHDMPVEESGNMIILTAAIVSIEKDISYAASHWDVLTTWAEYLRGYGFDPENQFCTDDFAGPLSRNANLSIKAIIAIGAYAKMAEMMGMQDVANEYRSVARRFVKDWTENAFEGDHYVLAFGQNNTWSQKYNIIWDKILNLRLFPESVVQKEMAFYHTKQNKYGLPLDNRANYTKSDWVMWTATLSTNQQEFEDFIEPLWRSVHESPNRQPLTDWYDTKSAEVMAFRARSVVGGFFIKLLETRMMEK